jgi:tetratricopeptide (TPR) repeat protein
MLGIRPKPSDAMGCALLLLFIICTCVPVIGQDECNDLLKSEKYDQAFSCYGKAIEKDPGSAMDWAGQGDVLNNMGYYNQALLYYYMALEKDPSIARIWASKGRTYTRLGYYTDAMTCLNKAIELDANDDYAWTSMGDLMTLMGKIDDAEEAYSKAKTLKSQAKSIGKSSAQYSQEEEEPSMKSPGR